MKTRFLTVAALVISCAFSVHAEKNEVMDLGTMEWKGKARGPQVEMLDSNRMDKAAAQKLTEYLVRKMEDKLLGTQTASEMELAE